MQKIYTRSDGIHKCEITERHCTKIGVTRGYKKEGLYTVVGRVSTDKIRYYWAQKHKYKGGI